MFRVLIADKDARTAHLFSSAIAAKTFPVDFEIMTVDSAEQVKFTALSTNIGCFILSLKEAPMVMIQTVRTLRKKQAYYHTPVVFLADTPDYLSLAYSGLHCLDYIIGREPETTFTYTISYLQYLLCGSAIAEDVDDRLSFRLAQEFLNLRIRDIVFIESYDRKCLIHTLLEDFLVPCTLKDIMQKQPCRSLMQCHRSYIVNLHHVHKICKDGEPWRIQFADYDTVAYVSRNYKQQIEEALSHL